MFFLEIAKSNALFYVIKFSQPAPGFIVCYDIDNVHIEIISIQKLFNIDCRKLVEILVLTLKK
jgi:hypothetical protein